MGKRLLIGTLLLVAATVAYHYYAASNAELALDESIQSVVAASVMNVNIDYASLDVNPFTGDILFSNINIIGDEMIQQIGSARIDLTYTDFLYFMIWGAEAGLRQVEEGVLELRNISQTNRSTFEEIKAGEVTLNYHGNLWNLLVLGITGRPAEIQHLVEATGESLTFSIPERSVGRISANSLEWQTRFGWLAPGADSFVSNLTLTGITWTPPENLQERYQFFIGGFGYATDKIPFESLSIRYDFNPDRNLLSIPAVSLSSELFMARASGSFNLETDSLGSNRIDSLAIRVSDMSPRFHNFVTQLQNLFGLQLLGGEDEINLLINGSMEEPRVQFGS